MPFAFIYRMPALGSGVRLSRKFHRGVMANNKLAISIINNEKTVSLSWPSVDNSQSYQIAYKPTSADEYNLVVSSKNFTVLNNLKEKAYHYSISPVDQEKGLLGPIYSGDITMEVRLAGLLRSVVMDTESLNVFCPLSCPLTMFLLCTLRAGIHTTASSNSNNSNSNSNSSNSSNSNSSNSNSNSNSNKE